jgi:hypothetical protein
VGGASCSPSPHAPPENKPWKLISNKINKMDVCVSNPVKHGAMRPEGEILIEKHGCKACFAVTETEKISATV